MNAVKRAVKPYKIVQSALIKRRCYIYDLLSGREIGMVTAYNTFPIWEAWDVDDRPLGPCHTRTEAAQLVYEAWEARTTPHIEGNERSK